MPAPARDAAIGIFDSGVGGLTVCRRVADCLPAESIVYLGDTARVPYGAKSAETVIRYALGCARVLTQRNIKLLIVACNTASAYALDALRQALDLPVLGVIEPGAKAAVARTRHRRIGVIGTPGTIASGIYPRIIHGLDADAAVICRACPLFVPLAEEGWVEGEAPRCIARTYLDDVRRQGVDTLVLGCTHYPLLRGVIAETMGDGVTLVDSAEATALAAREALTQAGLLAAVDRAGRHHFLVSDAPERFAEVGQRFLGYAIETVEWVDF